MRLQHAQDRFERENETLAPPSGPHRCRLARIIRRELLIQGDDDRLLTWEVSIQQAHADPRLPGDVPKRCGLVPPLADHPECDLIQAISGSRALRRLTRGTPTFCTLDIFSEHVH